MFCKKCGKELPDGTKFCPSCGANQEANESKNVFSQGGAQPTIDLNQTVNSFAEKNTDKLSEGETIIVKAKWNIVAFAILWGLYFLFVLLIKTYRPSYNYYDIDPVNLFNMFCYQIGVLYGPIFTPAVIIISIIVCALSIWLFLVRRELVVTNKKVYGRIGLIGTKTAVIPLNKIHYIAVRHTIIGRLIGSSSFLVYPGTIFGVAFRFVSNGEELKDAIENELYKN